MKTALVILLMLTIQGCSKYVNVCPKYPEPSREVLDKIDSLDSDIVDDWIVEQHVLSLKLKVCSE